MRFLFRFLKAVLVVPFLLLVVRWFRFPVSVWFLGDADILGEGGCPILAVT